MMNKNGAATIALAMVFVFAIAASAIALYAFINHSTAFGDRESDNEKVIEGSLLTQAYIESSAKMIMLDAAGSGFSRQSIMDSASRRDIHLAGQGNFFEKIRNGEFDISMEGGKSVLAVRGITAFQQSGKSSIKRQFDIEIEASSGGEFIRFINN